MPAAAPLFPEGAAPAADACRASSSGIPSLRDREASAFFQRLQRDPLMLLQILALIALTLALARPAVTVTGYGAKRVVVVLDTSASMKATDVSPRRASPTPSARRSAW